MRKIVKDFSNPPGELGPITIHNKRLIKIYNGTGTPVTSKIYPSIYGYSKVRKKLAQLYHNKCAYCEIKDYEFEVEHYRPKKGVEGEVHDGYFWLCYEWSNLIPACHDCNKKRSKSTKFPIIGTRVSRPIIMAGKYQFTDHLLLSRRLTREYPLLINPEETDFKATKYFKFDRTGLMIPSPSKKTRNYLRANETINNIVRLNRDNLYLTRRKNELRNYEKRFLGIFLKYFENFTNYGNPVANDNLKTSFFEILREIKERGDEKKEFSFFWNFVYDNVLNFLPNKLIQRPKDKTRFIDFINEFKENN